MAEECQRRFLFRVGFAREVSESVACLSRGRCPRGCWPFVFHLVAQVLSAATVAPAIVPASLQGTAILGLHALCDLARVQQFVRNVAAQSWSLCRRGVRQVLLVRR